MNAWINRKKGPDEVVSVIPDIQSEDFIGRILFDDQGFWIYDGKVLTVAEQEQLGKFIQHNMEVLWSS